MTGCGMDTDGPAASWPSLSDRDLASLMRLRNQVRERGYRHGRPWKRSGIGHLLQIDRASLLLEPISFDRWSGRVSCNGHDFPPGVGSTRGEAALSAVTAMFTQPLMVSGPREPEGPEPDGDSGFMARPF